MSDKPDGTHSGGFLESLRSSFFSGFQWALVPKRTTKSRLVTKEEAMVAEIYSQVPLVMERIEKQPPDKQMELVSGAYAVLGRNNPNNHFAIAAAFIVPNIYAEVRKILFVPKSQMRQLTNGTKAVFQEIFPPMAVVSIAMASMYFSQTAIFDALRPRLLTSSSYLPGGLSLMYQGKLKQGRELILKNEQTHTLPPLLYSTSFDYVKYLIASTFFVTQKLEISATPGVPNETCTTVSKVVDGSHLNFFDQGHRLIYGNTILKRVSHMLRADPEYVYDELTKLRNNAHDIDPELIEALEEYLPPMDRWTFTGDNRSRAKGKLIHL